MAKVYAPNKKYTGVSATVTFVNGVGESDNADLLAWFERNGYIVEHLEEAPPVPLTPSKTLGDMNVDELIAYAQEKGIDIGKATSQNGILEKIQEAEQAGGVGGK